MLPDINVMKSEDQHGSGLVGNQPIILVRGEGALLWDADGKQYIDCIGGHGVANVGHANPAVADAIARQAQRLLIAPAGFYNDQRSLAIQELISIAPDGLSRVFLCNSGAESVEAALKFARIATKRTGIVACMRGFHGRTLGALSATWRREYRAPFEPLVPGFGFVPYGRFERMEQAVDEDTAAVILEVVQGEGGVIPGDGDYLRRVERVCHDRGALFIIDEVQTGFGRTGRMFACQHHDLHPDILCFAKAVAGGLPMGGVLFGDGVGDLPSKSHGSTFGGNPVACAAAVAAMRFIEEQDLSGRAAELGQRMLNGFRAIDADVVREVRGLGLMIGIELKTTAASYLAALAERGVLALSAGSTVMRYLPPLVISGEEIDTVIKETAAVLNES